MNNNNKLLILQEFNNTFEEFINKMILQFPQESKLKNYYSAYKVAKLYDNSTPIKVFMGGCLQYEDEVKNRDSLFFQNKKSFVDKLTKGSSFTDDIGLINHWTNLSEISKIAIWDYIQTLFVMGKMYINDDANIVNNILTFYKKTSFTNSIKHINEHKTCTNDFISKLN